MSKTPEFDKTIEKYFSELKTDESGGLWRSCALSGEKFYIRKEDIDFYKKISVSLPTFSYKERLRRKLAYLNSYTLFRVKSAHSGKEIIAAYPPDTSFKIYEHQFWFSGEFDALGYGMDCEMGKNFFDQFDVFQRRVPRPNLMTDSTNVRSDFSNFSTHLKDCYLTFDTLSGENLYYFLCCEKSKDCIDCESMFSSEFCYSSQLVHNSYKCFFVERSFDCRDSYFLYDCRNCECCFMCSNLRHKKYCFMNQQLSKEEYEEKMKGINLGSYKTLKKYKNEFNELKRNATYKPDNNYKATNCFGDFIENSRGCYNSYFVFDSENTNYCMGLIRARDSYDTLGGDSPELCYEFVSLSVKDNYKVKFSFQMNNCREVEYSHLCRNCSYCFGCVGLDKKSFCIFNKQYSEKEYWKKLDKIKTWMLERREYGEFFPPRLSPFPYKISANFSYPGFRDLKEAEKYGYNVSDIDEFSDEAKENSVDADELPDNIEDTLDDILSKNVFDRENRKYFRLTKYELDFYKRFNLALPHEHPLIRLGRFREIYNLKIEPYERVCGKCGKKITSFYNPEVYKNVFCEECYAREIV